MDKRKSNTNVDNSSGTTENSTFESVDRISALPDSILGVILSLLPTKNAVATSVLSKRWEIVWRTVHNLDFCFENEGKQDDELENFIGFVNHVLISHDAGVLKKFRLVWRGDCVESHASLWIITALAKNVHELSLYLNIDLFCNVGFAMPTCVFSCDSLRSLYLEGWIHISSAIVFCLPRLKTLYLSRVTFESDETIENLIRGCPVLYYLNIDMEEDGRENRFSIYSTSLRRLELNLGCFNKYLKLEASSLEQLKIYNPGFVSMDFVLKDLSSLVEANIDIDMDHNEHFGAGYCNSMVNAFSALDRAKILSLSCDVMRALSCATVNLSTDFKRLVKLETTTYCCHWRPLRHFIQSSDNLEVLTIHQRQMYLNDGTEHDHSNWITPIEVPKCLSTSLKRVVIDGYNGNEDEREMISYMLKHGSVLEVVEISCYMYENRKKFELLQEICVFPRKSVSCEVKFCG